MSNADWLIAEVRAAIAAGRDVTVISAVHHPEGMRVSCPACGGTLVRPAPMSQSGSCVCRNRRCPSHLARQRHSVAVLYNT